MWHAKYEKQLSASVKTEHYNAVKQSSNEKNISMGEMVREILEQYFKEVKNDGRE